MSSSPRHMQFAQAATLVSARQQLAGALPMSPSPCLVLFAGSATRQVVCARGQLERELHMSLWPRLALFAEAAPRKPVLCARGQLSEGSL